MIRIYGRDMSADELRLLRKILQAGIYTVGLSNDEWDRYPLLQKSLDDVFEYLVKEIVRKKANMNKKK